jgi:L-threonylcarbamoyladenylate synthase
MARVLTLGKGLPPGRVAEVAAVLRDHGVVALPTESFYALGASPTDQAAVRRVIAIKGREEGKPILVLVGDRTQAESLAGEIGAAARLLMERFWPGPLTVIVKAASGLPVELTAGTGTVGLRHVGHPVLADLLRSLGPLTGTSANRSGEPPARSAQEVAACLGGEVDLILDGGTTAGGAPSTLVDTVNGLRLLREGAVPRARIAAILREAGYPSPS